MRYCLHYSGTGFRPLKLEITLFPNGFRLKLSVRFGNTIVTSSIGDRTAILRGHEIHARAGLAVCRAKTMPSCHSYLKTLGIRCLVPGVEPTTSYSEVKRSTD